MEGPGSIHVSRKSWLQCARATACLGCIDGLLDAIQQAVVVREYQEFDVRFQQVLQRCAGVA